MTPPWLYDAINATGVVLILSAYVMQQRKVISTDAPLYLWLNLVGSTLASIGSVLIVAYPFAVLEGVWAAVSAIGLIRAASRH